MDWLNFVGKSYYKTIGAFKSEADKYRVSRRISLLQLKSFNKGDRVYLFQWDKKKKASIIFGYFDVDSIYCANSKSFVNENRKNSKQDKEVEKIKHEIIEEYCKRKCGEYNICEYLFLDLTIDEIEKEFENHNCQKPMIGGRLQLIETSQSQIHFQRGFRRFNHEKYDEKKAQGKKAKDQYSIPNHIAKTNPQKKQKGITVISIENYRKKDDMKKDKMSN